MSKAIESRVPPFTIRAADKLAAEVAALVRSGKLDARSKAGDALLGYASIRFGSSDPIGDLLSYAEQNFRTDE